MNSKDDDLFDYGRWPAQGFDLAKDNIFYPKPKVFSKAES